jgi:hypothetical protein
VAHVEATEIGDDRGGCSVRRPAPRDRHGFARFLPCEILGGIALIAFAIEMLRYWLSSRLRQAHPSTALLCEGLLLYAGWFYVGLCIFVPPSLDYDGGSGFVIDVHLLLPFLLAIDPLVRSRA